MGQVECGLQGGAADGYVQVLVRRGGARLPQGADRSQRQGVCHRRAADDLDLEARHPAGPHGSGGEQLPVRDRPHVHGCAGCAGHLRVHRPGRRERHLVAARVQRLQHGLQGALPRAVAHSLPHGVQRHPGVGSGPVPAGLLLLFARLHHRGGQVQRRQRCVHALHLRVGCAHRAEAGFWKGLLSQQTRCGLRSWCAAIRWRVGAVYRGLENPPPSPFLLSLSVRTFTAQRVSVRLSL
mmetsp:Transcript_4823/g.13934  ORF Transcript_4823/g.13934 Transcript_4823/m.13934 type:complete len:238 (-) Transcript_4823:6-719(-)